MNKNVLLTLSAMLLAGAVFTLSSTVYSDDDDSRDDAGRALRFFAVLTGAQEVATLPVVTQGRGRIEASFDEGFTRVVVDLRVQGLSGDALRAHFHCQRPGVNGPIPFGLFDPGPCVSDGLRTRCTLRNENVSATTDCVPQIGRPVNNIAALAFAMRDGLIYANVHTAMFPGGEIRGQMLER